MSETEVQTLTKQLFDDDRLAKLIRNPQGWLGCSPNATTVSFQDRLKANEDENQDAAWEIKIANAKEKAERQTREKDDPESQFMPMIQGADLKAEARRAPLIMEGQHDIEEFIVSEAIH
ncbi:hypothetical protein LTR67_008071 [Exophiala xenobiotica]